MAMQKTGTLGIGKDVIERLSATLKQLHANLINLTTKAN